jgi:DNA invertase Pin-like site-specific DNA recombinase
MTRATAYLRTSSAANIDGDSPYRQNDAVMRFAAGMGIEVISCFWDADVKGSDFIETRDGFAALLRHCEVESISMVLVDDPSRFARDIIAQEMGLRLLTKRGVRLVTASGMDMSADSSDPGKKMMRQMVGMMAEYDKDMVVHRLRSGRDRIKATGAKCEGRKAHAELTPQIGREARRLARKSPKTGKTRSLRQIAAELATLGFLGSTGKPLSPSVVRDLIA